MKMFVQYIALFLLITTVYCCSNKEAERQAAYNDYALRCILTQEICILSETPNPEQREPVDYSDGYGNRVRVLIDSTVDKFHGENFIRKYHITIRSSGPDGRFDTVDDKSETGYSQYGLIPLE